MSFANRGKTVYNKFNNEWHFCVKPVAQRWRSFFRPLRTDFMEGTVKPMEQSNQFLGTENVGRLMKRYAIPCIISLLVGALYNIVDQIFIANAYYLGSYGNAANTVVFPLTVVALAIAVMIGDGCCAYVSIRLGRN